MRTEIEKRDKLIELTHSLGLSTATKTVNYILEKFTVLSNENTDLKKQIKFLELKLKLYKK